ncbi:hypothetical protein TBLA_0G00920 [Henningerozyma blattae CBS 6284]|uniref:Uncharacterized protein n=1 Tax=Henningerozyma blattae (strain ATCC 34711 / CBS 6284 / DSM 70876 / NBRC 10599 / NRRL Y-10934 / UCD 77-7) TaxID=1071380 RepID=I2H6N7_HENB6|nr:hypothetical protein TBLA_0G00920 [Tetrapisispora blattae CBS 6284]CCH62039.1 hypothetical protein TBLA_0G00920 [Tetrapisispora blattae CBS 6284]
MITTTKRVIIRCMLTSVLLLLIILQISKPVDKNYIPNEINNIIKRADRPIWDLGRTSAVIGLALTAANALYTAWSPVLCIVPTSPACWTLAIGLSVSAGVSTIGIAYAAYQDYFNGEFNIIDKLTPASSNILNRYRSQYELSNTTMHVFPSANDTDSQNMLYSPNDIYDDIVYKFVTAGLGTPLLTTSEVAKENKNSAETSTNDVITIHWNSPLGRHTATNLEHYNVQMMADDIIEQFLSGYEGSDLYSKSIDIMFQNNNERQTVNWVSYNMNEGGPKLETLSLWESIRGIGKWDGNIKTLAEMFYKNNIYDSWKWNVDVITDTDINSSGWFDRRKKRAITHGEVYLNQYGGLE